VRPVIVHDQMHVQARRHVGVDLVEERAELFSAAVALTLPQHLARFHVQRGKQGRRAVAHISRESLNVSLRCGCNAKARQIRLTALWLAGGLAGGEDKSGLSLLDRVAGSRLETRAALPALTLAG